MHLPGDHKRNTFDLIGDCALANGMVEIVEISTVTKTGSFDRRRK
jgi:hypothetical protein